MTSPRPLAIPGLSAYPSTSEDGIALIDSKGYVIGVNDKWWTLADWAGAARQQIGPGANYLDTCHVASYSNAVAGRALRGIQSVLKGKLRSFRMDYAANSASRKRYFRMAVIPVRYQDARFIVAHSEITDLRRSNAKQLKRLQVLARRLINAQEEERDRIAREIHDSVGSHLALLSFALRRTVNERAKPLGPRHELNQILDQINDLSSALRNLSHFLHSPVLTHAGISVALKAFCEEFARTQGIQVDVVTPDPEQFPRLPKDIELCLYRVSQECLHNIVEHAGPCSVSMVLKRTSREVQLTVSDTGRGFHVSEAPPAAGLGLVSMKERVLSIKGHLKIWSTPGTGTEISVKVPLPRKRPESPRISALCMA